jgi:AMP-dependent synthetase/ligase
MIPDGLILEGYGITECSPIISINPIEHQKAQSVGIAIGNSEIKILDLETEEELKSNQEGMIYYSGPSVFNGYSDKSIESPFIKKE